MTERLPAGSDVPLAELGYQRLFESLPSPHLVLSPDLRVVAANTAYLHLLATTREQLVGRKIFEAYPPTPDAVDDVGAPLLARAFDEVLETGRAASSFVERYDLADPATGQLQEHWWSHTVSPVLGPAGEVQLLVQRVDEVTGYVHAQEAGRAAPGGPAAGFDELQAQLYARSRDVQAARDAQRRTERFLEAMPSGFLSLDPGWRFTLVNGAAEQLLGSTQAQLLGRTIWDAFPATVGGEFEAGYRRAVETGAPQTLEAYYPVPLEAWYEVLCWPTSDGLSLYFSDITARVRADGRAARTAARLALVAEVSQALVLEPTYDVLHRLPQLLVPVIADSCIVTEIGPDGRARDVSSWHAQERFRSTLQEYANLRLDELPPDAPLGRSLRTGVAEHLTADDIEGVPLNSPARALLDQLGRTRASIHPLRGRGEVLGALSLFSAADRAVDPDDEATAQDIADRLGAALHASRVSSARTQLAEDLQRSLLTAPPEPDHAQVVVRYLPAGQANRVGGDWYDAFLQSTGNTMIVIGDVVGHDTAAAAAMGQLRGLLRGIATYSSAGPAEVLRGLDAAMQLLQIGTLATATVARFEQTVAEVEHGETRMVWANAGHPPPLVLHPDGTIELLEPVRAELLLGVDPAVQRSEHTTVLDRGATVLLYSDGLVERHDSDLDAGLHRLVAAAHDLAGAPLDELCDGLIDRLVGGRPTDDVAVVAIRLHRQDRPRPADAGPQRVPDGVPEPAHPAQ